MKEECKRGPRARDTGHEVQIEEGGVEEAIGGGGRGLNLKREHAEKEDGQGGQGGEYDGQRE